MSACCAGERAGIYVRNVSSNGTYLNDSLLEGSRLLAHGDQVQIKNKAQADMFRSVPANDSIHRQARPNLAKAEWNVIVRLSQVSVHCEQREVID